MRVEDDAIVAEVALKWGWLAPEALRRALELQWAAVAAGVEARLLDVLVARGLLGSAHAQELEGAISLGVLAEPEQCGTIHGYRIFRGLGQNGLGGLFKAVQLSMDRPVALKVLAPNLARDSSVLERFLREARAVGRINHPNIIGGLDSGCCGDYHYYSMEAVEGQELRQLLRAGPLAAGRLLDIAVQMTRALIHAAELGLVHRDIHPGNILLAAEGTARLCGLGATRFPQDPSATETGIPVGTPHYISPELAAGAKSVDIRSDVYSLGATLYHLATGQPPFQASSLAALLLKHTEEPLRPPIEVRPDVPRGVSDLIVRMMAKNPLDRCASLDRLLSTIEAVQGRAAAAPEGPAAVPASSMPTIAPPGPVEAPVLASAPEAATPVEPMPLADAAAGLPSIARPSGAEPTPRTGRRWSLAGVAWAALVVALVGLLAAATARALRARAMRSVGPAEGPEARKELPVPSAGPAQGTAAESPPGPRGGRGDELAQRLVAEALAFEKRNPDAHGAALLPLRRALLATGPAPGGGLLEERMAAHERALSDAAGAAWQRLTGKLKAHRKLDEYGAALRACADAPRELLFGRWAADVQAQAANLGTLAEQRYLELATLGAAALQGPRPADALPFYQRIGELGIPWIARVGAGLLPEAKAHAEREQQRLDQVAAADATAQRRRAQGRLTDRFKAVHEELRAHQYAKALELCEKTPAALREGALGEAMARLEARVRTLRAVWEAIAAGPEAAIGKPFPLFGQSGVIVGFKHPGENCQLGVRPAAGAAQSAVYRPIRSLPAAQFTEFAEWALSRELPSERAAKVGVFCLAAGKLDEARQKLEEASKLGARVADSLADLQAEELVAKALAACQKEQWEEARGLIGAALDHHGISSAAILNHPGLMAALAQCAVHLKEAAGPPSSAPVPLPDALRRLGLLPPCRLSAMPPADPLAAHFASPLERVSPVLLGFDDWKDYLFTLRWKTESDQGSRFVLLFRFVEIKAGQFGYYYIAANGERLTLGRHIGARNEEFQALRCPDLLKPGDHHLLLVASGPSLRASLDGEPVLRATDGTLTKGNIGLWTSEARLLVLELSAELPAPWPRTTPPGPRP